MTSDLNQKSEVPGPTGQDLGVHSLFLFAHEPGGRIRAEMADPAQSGAVLSVNRRDVAKEIWNSDG